MNKPLNNRKPCLRYELILIFITYMSNINRSNLCRVVACHLTYADLEVINGLPTQDFGLGVNMGLEMVTLPQGSQLRKDIIERWNICFRKFSFKSNERFANLNKKNVLVKVRNYLVYLPIIKMYKLHICELKMNLNWLLWFD